MIEVRKTSVLYLEVDELQLGISTKANDAVQVGNAVVPKRQALEVRARIQPFDLAYLAQSSETKEFTMVQSAEVRASDLSDKDASTKYCRRFVRYWRLRHSLQLAFLPTTLARYGDFLRPTHARHALWVCHLYLVVV